MSDVIRRLMDLLRQLPGVGEKSAARLAFHILSSPPEYAQALAAAVLEIKQRVHFCKRCGNFTELELCEICSDTRRDATVLCVVERVQDLLAIESSHQYRGAYHVLHGILSPLDGTGPDQIRVAELMQRLPGEIREVILATSSSVEGEATALYLKKRLGPMGLKVSRIASGIPVGGELEYVDRGTIGRALSGRREME